MVSGNTCHSVLHVGKISSVLLLDIIYPDWFDKINNYVTMYDASYFVQVNVEHHGILLHPICGQM